MLSPIEFASEIHVFVCTGLGKLFLWLLELSKILLRLTMSNTLENPSLEAPLQCSPDEVSASSV